MYGQERFANINQTLNRRIDQKKHLIAVHRGSWGGNIIQNTVESYTAAIKMGADMVESDVNASTDGVLYSFHDGHEPDVFGVSKNIKTMDSAEIESYHPLNAVSLRCSRRINRLTEILEFLPEGVLLNIDRAWDIYPQVLEVLDRYPQARFQVVLKAPLKAAAAFEALSAHPVKYMFMPICYSLADVDAALAYTDVNTVGAEIIAPTPQAELFDDGAIAYIHGKGLYCWVNAINLGDVGRDGLYGGLDDDVSVIRDPALGWGKLFDKRIDIIQTDWPALLHAYRAQRLRE
ncbi:MAG: glycerophosphodiester phosphodiesterase family protein [Clostridia bacterium]|nr:glycerophosphodiester phosphodiesterase family protein [Clostridia bacterium]